MPISIFILLRLLQLWNQLIYFRIRKLKLVLLVLGLHFVLSLASRSTSPGNHASCQNQKPTRAQKLLDDIIKVKRNENVILISDNDHFNYRRSNFTALTTIQLDKMTNQTISDVSTSYLKTNIPPLHLMFVMQIR